MNKTILLDNRPEAIKQLGLGLGESKLTYKEIIVEGFEKTPQALIALLKGKNKGKMITKV
ncbi:hypothetical protein [Sediminicola arcticus]|jgi:NADPH-dependent curcumin reductase CurA|uniref:Uncharacterized protein n=1 Tax=Sediminicola arcticus TaxID=1574308 RepID=A0ABV2SQY0_9FLAO